MGRYIYTNGLLQLKGHYYSAFTDLTSPHSHSLTRRVDIHDTDEMVFRHFLDFLYGGGLTTASMATEELVELLAVADRYAALPDC